MPYQQFEDGGSADESEQRKVSNCFEMCPGRTCGHD